MNLFELFVKIGVDDQASGALGKISSGLGKGLATAAKIGTAAVGAAAAGITALTTAAVNNYAEYEQLVGGVETLFGKAQVSVNEYVNSAKEAGKTAKEAFEEYSKIPTAADKVIEYASKAYETAGMSANEYMSTVTSFSASLLQSLGGDTAAAAEKADLAITDMADNANKMGTSMEMIQNAYQGFAKQNYTMLDNLKLGYGGTKEEMQRLLKDAEKLSGQKFDLSSYSDIVDAIHVVQTEMGITGTTAKEAGTTIQGSVASMKSAWTNLVTGFADGSADIGGLIDNLVTTIVGDGTETNLGVIGNVLPAIETALGGIAKLIEGAAPKIIEILPGLVERIVPSVISAATGMVNAVIAVLPDFLNTLVDALIQNAPTLITAAIGLVQSLVQGIQDNYQILVNGAIQIVTQLSNGILEMLPEIIKLGLDLIVSLASGISENLPKIIPTIIDIINQIIETITENLPLLITSALEIIVSLANGIAESLPELIPTIVDVVIQIVETLIDNVDMLVDSAIAIITALANGLINALPRLIEKAPEIVGKLVSAIVNNAPKLLKSALEIIVTLAKGLVANIPKLVKVIPQIVSSIVNGFLSLMSKITGIGKNIVNGVWQGIQSMVSWFTSKVRNFFSGIVNSVKNALGIHSPSKVFASIGKYMAEGLGEGWDDKFSDVRDEIDKSLDFDDPSMTINASVHKIGTDAAGISGMAYRGTSIGTVTINIDGAKYSNENSLAEAIADALQNMTDRREAVYA